MATKLKNLRITKVDFVDQGANPDAHIKLFKRKGEAGELKDTAQKEPNILKRLVAFIGKAAGMEPEDIDTVMEEIQKGDAESFNERYNETRNRKIIDEIWDVCYALESALASIINDADMDGDAVKGAMQESLNEFVGVVGESITQWAAGNSASIVRKNEVSSAELENAKSVRDRLTDTITQIEKAVVTESENHEPKGEERMSNIDKSKLTPAERAFLEEIEKRCGTEDAGGTPSADIATPGGAQVPASEPAGAGMAKSVSQPPASQAPADHTADNNDAEDIYKGLHPLVAAELQRLQKRADEADEKELTEIAKKYEIIGKKPEELVPVLKSLKAAGGSAYTDMIGILDASVEAVNKSSMFTEIGKSGGYGGSEPDAWCKIEKKADEIQVANPDMSRQVAIDKACQQNPQLVHEYENGR